MRRIILRLVLGIALFAIEFGAAQAQDAIVKLDGFPGEAQRAGYAGWIEALNWSVGQGLAPSSGLAGARPFVFTKKIDRSSPKLAAAAATGVPINNAVLDVWRTGGGGTQYLFYRIILHDVTLRDYSTTWSPSSAIPMEQIALGYSKIEWYYFSPGTSGAVILQSQAKFDVAKNALYQ